VRERYGEQCITRAAHWQPARFEPLARLADEAEQKRSSAACIQVRSTTASTVEAAADIQLISSKRELHWPEYAIEAVLLGAFMISACAVTALLEHPASPLHAMIPDALGRRALIGIAMGSTAVGLIYSPWGQQSGAHFNPSVTLTYLRLGKIEAREACAYIAAQCVGGILGVLLISAVLGMVVAHPAVHFAATVPGPGGAGIAFVAEFTISFVLMAIVLLVSNSRAARFTGLVCGAIVAAYITFEAPYSGMSMNPARSLASAVMAGEWTSFWVYVSAPPLAMLAAAELYVRICGARRVFCAKLNHHGPRRCIFRCTYGEFGKV
jgi:aquaporin Z